MAAYAPPAAAGAEPLLAIHGLSKTFGGARALDQVSLSVAPGEIHGLLGANGSGKSTLIKVLAGVHAPDPGARVTLRGQELTLPLHAGAFRQLGLSFVHQNLGLIPELSVLENLRIAAILDPEVATIDWRAQRRAAAETVSRFGLALDLDRPVRQLAPADRALLAIARGFEDLKAAPGRGVLVLDEPTPFLPADGVRRLFALMRGVAAAGHSVIFISHDVDEILEITDRVTVLRDGRTAGSRETRGAGRDDIVELILGRRIEVATATPRTAPFPSPLVTLRGVEGGALQGVDLDVAPGEVVGLTGLVGSGYADLAEMVFGARPARAGAMTLEGRSIGLMRRTPRASIADGVGFVPADRPVAGGVGALSVADNITLLSLDAAFRKGVLRRGALSRQARSLGERFDVRPNRPELAFGALSGGNAQKVVIARWLSLSPRLLLLDEPTQGVDVGTREQIFAALRQETARGMAVIVASTDCEQLAMICDRVVVFRRGRIQGQLTAPGLTKDAIAHACYATEDQGAP